MDKIKEVQLDNGEVLTSFDVSALFASVPGNEVVEMAIRRAKSDTTWSNRTKLTSDEFGDFFSFFFITFY